MLSHISFASIPVTDPDRAKAFWSGTMGLEVTVDAPMEGLRWIMLRLPGGATQLHLDQVERMPHSARPALPFITEDVAGTTAALKDKSVEIVRPAGPAEWDPNTTYSIIRDSEGNMILLADR